jgi:hypothetical protein
VLLSSGQKKNKCSIFLQNVAKHIGITLQAYTYITLISDIVHYVRYIGYTQLFSSWLSFHHQAKVILHKPLTKQPQVEEEIVLNM